MSSCAWCAVLTGCPACRTAGAARGGPRWDASAGAPDPAGFDMDAETMIWTPTIQSQYKWSKLIIYDIVPPHPISLGASSSHQRASTRARAQHAQAAAQALAVGLGPPAAARTSRSLVRSTKNETLTKPGLHLCLSVINQERNLNETWTPSLPLRQAVPVRATPECVRVLSRRRAYS